MVKMTRAGHGASSTVGKGREVPKPATTLTSNGFQEGSGGHQEGGGRAGQARYPSKAAAIPNTAVTKQHAAIPKTTVVKKTVA